MEMWWLWGLWWEDGDNNVDVDKVKWVSDDDDKGNDGHCVVMINDRDGDDYDNESDDENDDINGN